MAGYHDALTRIFLKGGFPGRSATAAPPARPKRVAPSVPASLPLAEHPRTAMESRTTRHRPTNGMESSMTHPGQILARHLNALGLTASDLARDIDVPVNRVTAIINGQRGVTADTALRLGHWFGVDPEDWLQLQLQYELAAARRAIGAKIRVLPSLATRRQE